MPRYRVQKGDRIVHRGADHHEALDAYAAAVAESTPEEVTLFSGPVVVERFRPKERKESLWGRIWRRLVCRSQPMEEVSSDNA